MLAYESSDDAIVAFGPFRLDLRERTLFKNGKVVRLSRKVFDVIAFLATHRGAVVTPNELIDAVWAGEAITDSNVAQHICFARRILEDSRKPHKVITTIHGRGYLFAANSPGNSQLAYEGPADSHELVAQELYQNGKSFAKCGTEAALRSSLLFYARAAELCPLYEPAYSAAGETHAKLAWRLYQTPSVAFDNARAAARHALLLDPESAFAHATLAGIALCADYDAEAAHEHLRAAARRRPELPMLHVMRMYAYLFDRRPQRALLAAHEALSWVPDSAILRAHVGLNLFFLGSYDEAIRYLEEFTALEPGAAFARYLLGASYLFAGNLITARERLHEVVERELPQADECDFNPRQHALSALIFLEARAGNHDTAVRLYHEFASYFPGQFISPVALAAALAGFGHAVEAAQKLREARASGDPRLIFLGIEPYFLHLHGEVQFETACAHVLVAKSVIKQ